MDALPAVVVALGVLYPAENELDHDVQQWSTVRLLAKVLDTCSMLHAEHTMKASTFSGMVTVSTLADLFLVVS